MFIMHPFVYMHLTGNHTKGIVSGFEDYDVLKASCKNIFAEINELVDAGEIEVDGHKIPLEFYLSGDYKVKEQNYTFKDQYSGWKVRLQAINPHYNKK